MTWFRAGAVAIVVVLASCSDPEPVANDQRSQPKEPAPQEVDAQLPEPEAEWVQVDEDLDDVRALVSYNGGYLSLRTAPDAVAFWFSLDGHAWERVHKETLGNIGQPWENGEILVLPDNSLAAFVHRPDGSHLWHSEDGRSWERLENGPPWAAGALQASEVRDIQLLDSGHVLATAFANGKGVPTRTFWLSTTSAIDNSALATLGSWRRLFVPGSTNGSSALVEADGTWLVQTWSSDGTASGPFLQRSDDRGATWQTTEVSAATGLNGELLVLRLLPFTVNHQFVLWRSMAHTGQFDGQLEGLPLMWTSPNGNSWVSVAEDRGVFGDGPLLLSAQTLETTDEHTRVLPVEVGLRWDPAFCVADPDTCRETEMRWLTFDAAGKWGVLDLAGLTPAATDPGRPPRISTLTSGETVVEFGTFGDPSHQLWIHRGHDVADLQPTYPEAEERPTLPSDQPHLLVSPQASDAPGQATERLTLASTNGCVVLESPEGTLLALWPPGTKWDPIGGLRMGNGVYVPFGAELDVNFDPVASGDEPTGAPDSCADASLIRIADASPVYPGVSVGTGWCDNGHYLLQFDRDWLTTVGFTHTPVPRSGSVSGCRLVWPRWLTSDDVINQVAGTEIIRTFPEYYGEGTPGIWVNVLRGTRRQVLDQFLGGLNGSGSTTWTQTVPLSDVLPEGTSGTYEQGEDGRQIISVVRRDSGQEPALQWLVLPDAGNGGFLLFTANAVGLSFDELRETGDEMARLIRRSSECEDPPERIQRPPTEPGAFTLSLSGELNPDVDGSVEITVTNNGSVDAWVVPEQFRGLQPTDGSDGGSGGYTRQLYAPVSTVRGTAVAPGETITLQVVVATTPCNTSTGPRLANGTYYLVDPLWTFTGPPTDAPDLALQRVIPAELEVEVLEEVPS